MADLAVLGVFEDRSQQEFQTGLLQSEAESAGLELFIEARRTDGCHYGYLREHVRFAPLFDGLLIGVDGQKRSRDGKIRKLQRGVAERGLEWPTVPTLWSVAIPSIEEWMMADVEALPAVLEDELDVTIDEGCSRPGPAASERTAKRRLGEWVECLVGRHRILRGGMEYAEKVGAFVRTDHVGEERNADLRTLLDSHLPRFLDRCSEHKQRAGLDRGTQLNLLGSEE